MKRMSVTYNMMYSVFEEMKTRLDLEASFWMGSATKGTKRGVSRNVLKRDGMWKAGAVEVYCHEIEARVVISQALVEAKE